MSIHIFKAILQGYMNTHEKLRLWYILDIVIIILFICLQIVTAIQICLFTCLFTLYLLLTKKANNDLLNKYVKYNHIWLQIIVHNWLILASYQLKNKIRAKILDVLRDQT